ncbi:MAG: zinc ABC transporter substrate-binding protein, partial [Pseudomonadota bacterium]
QTRTDIVAMTRADLVLWHGLYLEAQMEDFFKELSQKRTLVAVADGLDRSKLRAHDEYKDKFDPHVWMDPALWADVVGEVRDALSKVSPANKAAFEQNTAAYVKELNQLAAKARASLATVPKQARVLITAHDAFAYFGGAYGFEVMGIQGISTESEAGLRRIRELVNQLVGNDIKAVFVETSVSDRNIRALIEGAAAKGHEVKIGGELFSDAMGEPGTFEGTYLGMLDHNTTTITRALGGKAPERGHTGRLSAGA